MQTSKRVDRGAVLLKETLFDLLSRNHVVGKLLQMEPPLATGYGFRRFIREGEFSTFVGVGGAAVDSSMTNIPQIGSTANGGSTSERPRKNNKSDNHHEILTFLDHLIKT